VVIGLIGFNHRAMKKVSPWLCLTDGCDHLSTEARTSFGDSRTGEGNWV